MSNFIATAVVQVKADTKPFLTELQTQVRAIEKKKIEIAVGPNFKGFVAEVNTKVKRMQFAHARVTVVPDMTGFRTKLIAAIKEVEKGLPNVKVQVSPVATGAAATAASGAAGVTTGGVVDRRAADAQRAVTAATDAGIAARRRMTDAISVEEKRAARLVREELALEAATKAVRVAAISGVPALLAEAEALERVARAAVATTVAQQQRAAAAASAAAANSPEAIAAAAASAEARATEAARAGAAKREAFALNAHNAAINASEASRKKQISDIETLVKADRTATTERLRAANLLNSERLAGILAAQRAERKAIAQAADIRAERVQTGVSVVDPTGDFGRTAAIERSTQEAAESSRQLTRARRQELAVSKIVDNVEAQLSASRVVLRTTTSALVAAELARDAALDAELPELVAVRQRELELAAARQQAAASTVAALEKQAVAAGRVGAGRRALEAFGANLAGLRGAALSAQGAFVATAAAAIAVTKAVQESAAFESELAVFRVTAAATADEMERVRSTAAELGRDITLPGVSARDSAEALTQLSKAGLDVENSLAGARGVLQLATAAQISNAEATTLTASALNSFGLAGDQAVRVADVLANAANAAQGSIVDMGVALQQASAVARQAGLSLEETTAVLTLFARSGLRGSDAGTSFRTALIRLINPTAKAQKVIDKLGLSLRDSSGNIDLGVFQQFADATREMTAAQRDQALAIIFGQDAIRGAAILAREGAAGLNAQVIGLQKSGTAAEVAGARMTGVTGAVENLKNQLSTLGITIGTILTPAVKGVVDQIATLTGAIDRSLSPIASLVKGAVDLAEKFKDIATIDIFGFEIGPERILNPLKTVKEAQDALFSDSGTELNLARQAVAGLVLELNKVGESRFGTTIQQLEEMRTRLASGDENAQAFAKDIAVVIKNVQRVGADFNRDPLEFNVVLPPEILNGKPGELAGRAAKEGFKREFKFGANEDFGLGGFLGAFANQFEPTGTAAAGKFFSGFAKRFAVESQNLVRAASGQLAALQGEAIGIENTGGSNVNQKLLANLRKQEKAARDKIAAEKRRLKPGQRSSEDLRTAQNDLKGVLDTRKSIRQSMKDAVEKAAQEAEEDAREAQRIRDDADEAFFDSLNPEQQRVERLTNRAAGTENLEDDRRALVAQKGLLLKEIALIDRSVNDRKKAAEQIDQRRTEITKIDNDIADKTQEIADASFQRKQTRLQRRQEHFESIGDITGQLRVINRRIAGYNKLLRELKGERAVFEKYIQERDDLRRDREALQEERFDQKIELGQAIFDLTGNKTPLLLAIEASVKNTLKEIKAAQQAGESTDALRIKLLGLLKQRKDALNEAAGEAKQGTTALDILTEAAETFNRNAGTLITGDQPFAGPTGFTADIAQWLVSRRSMGAGGGGTNANLPGLDTSDVFGRAVARSPRLAPTAKQTTEDKFTRAILDLIAALDRNTETKGTNDAANAAPFSMNRYVDVTGRRAQAMARFWEARQQREAVEG